MMCCASCDIAAMDGIELKECDDCDLVRYCSDKCQQEHRPKHEATCKERAAELRDEILFRQPECSSLGDCPICFLPHSLDSKKSVLQSCCCTTICKGCYYANIMREMEQNLQYTCPFCRHPRPKSEEEGSRNKMKRAAANDPAAMQKMGGELYYKGDYATAFEYWTRASKLGDMNAHYNLSILYQEGKGFEKSEKMQLYHLEEAAIAGHPSARYNLACYEGGNERMDRAVKHFIIAANLGCDDSIKMLKHCYVNGHVSKEDFAAALRAQQAAADAMTSPQREAAEAAGELVWGYK